MSFGQYLHIPEVQEDIRTLEAEISSPNWEAETLAFVEIMSIIMKNGR